MPCSPLFPAEAEAALKVFRDLRIVDAADSPRIGDACRPWVMDFAASVFGSYNHETGRRLIREFFLLVSKKNSKSTIAAGIMLTALVRNWRRSAEFLILAPTIEIAKNSFDPAADMIRADPELDALFHIADHTRTITHKTMRATLRVVAADKQTVGGKKAVGVLIDEHHLFGRQPDAGRMLREAVGGLASRPEGFVILLSTQASDQPAGVFKEKLSYYRGIRDGTITDQRSLGVLYEFPQAMLDAGAHMDRNYWHLTNPNMGASVDLEFLDDEYRKAQSAGPGEVQDFFAKHLNVEVGLALRSDRWAGADYWERQANTTLTLDELLDRSEVVTVGIDGGGLDDLLGLAVLGRAKLTREWLLWSHAWAHPMALERRKQEASRYRDFEQEGDMTIVEALPEDISGAISIVQRIYEADLLGGVGLDQIGLGGIVDALAEIEVTQEAGLVHGISQGWRQANAIKSTERKLADGTLWHSGQPLMAWCVGNAKVEPRGNAIAITKQAAGYGKIDPLMAAFNAVELMGRNPEAHVGTSPYERHGVRAA